MKNFKHILKTLKEKEEEINALKKSVLTNIEKNKYRIKELNIIIFKILLDYIYSFIKIAKLLLETIKYNMYKTNILKIVTFKKIEKQINSIKIDKLKRVTKVLESSKHIYFDDSSKIILMSDCHRGDGSWADNFSNNQNIYFVALNHYYKRGFTYIEIGDGDELWENNNLLDIIHIHSNVFWLLTKFLNDKRLYMIFGNHDIVKKNKNFAKKYEKEKENFSFLFRNIKFHEGLVLRHIDTDNRILLIHGHQVDTFNDRMWRLSRFLVKYLWKPLESYGVKDPTSTAKNYKKKKDIEKRLLKWVEKNKHMLVAGHTHRPVFPKVGDPPYFNDGSCVHPRCITGIEIEDGHILLVKWCIKTKNDGTLFIGREVLEGPIKLKEFFVA